MFRPTFPPHRSSAGGSAARGPRAPRTRRPGAAAAAAGLALAVVGGVTSASAAQSPEANGAGRPAQPASVSGSARIFYTYAQDDEIRFTFDAVSAPYTRPVPGNPELANGMPTDARGTVRYSHHSAAQNVTYTAEGTVDCLVTGGRTATLTAVITKSDIGNVGQRVGFSVYDGGRKDVPGHSEDRLGFSWGVANLDIDAAGVPVQPVVGTCMAPAPFAPVLQGGFTVHHADLPPRPTDPAPGHGGTAGGRRIR
ncbi:hypothetical protein ACFC1R_18950 [Kitasatospora sp. NPDC056138]|uniref:hypothetical protein n=1 Tax=Kitasatospora sp. NPDC056138 TaxID=3345724 RepID=UPI0035E11E99